jgi:iron complex transport system permease protein
MARITLDLDALVADGRLTSAEAERLAGMAMPGRGISTVIQVLYILGALGLAGGVMALKPDPVTGMALAALAIGFAVFAQATKREDMGLLGTAMGICGTVGLCGSIGLQFGETLPAITVNGIITAITLAVAILLRSRFLAALVPLGIAALLGSSSEYWHASYAIIVKESTITVIAFAVLSGILFLGAHRLRGVWAQMATVAGRVSWLLMNFGFWVGSLWGDHIGDGFIPENAESATGLESFRAGALFIPEWVFIFAWAAVSVLTIVFMHRNRFAVNASITFLAINVYTQFFEWFGGSAFVMLTGGVTLLAFAFGLYHFDRWMIQRTRETSPGA